MSAGAEYDALVERLIVWIVDNSDYADYGHPRPHIVKANDAFMINKWEEITKKESDGNILALHVWDFKANDVGKSTIYVGTDLNIHNYLDVKTLVHELVHHLQYWSGKNYEVGCSKELEHDAYMIAAKYLIAVRYSDKSVIAANQKRARSIGTCPPPKVGKYIKQPNWLKKYD